MGKVKWIVFDLDVEKSHLDNLHDPAFRLWLEQGFQKIINEFRELLKIYHLEMNVEFSGYKGYHLWILLKEKIPAYVARSFAQRIVAQITFNGLPISIEIFPKQVRTSWDNYGNLVKLPYGRQSLEMKSTLDKLIKPEEDSICYYLLCKNCARNIAISGPGTYT
jgi:hypothetical protein